MKKQILSIMMCLFVAVTMLPAAISVSASETYLALGDSITAGYGLDSEDEFFTNIFAMNHGFNVVNKAKYGNTASGIISQIESGELNDYISSASIITITCGGNDLMNILYDQIANEYNSTYNTNINGNDVTDIFIDSSDLRRIPLALTALGVLEGDLGNSVPAFAESDVFLSGLDTYVDNLNTIISYIRSINTNAKIVVATQYNPYKSFTGFYYPINHGINKGVKKLNEAIINNSMQNEKYIVADVYTEFENDSRNLCIANVESLNLDFHPNKDGHTVIARCIENTLYPASEVVDIPASEVTDISDFRGFSDVSETDWFYDSVKYVCVNNLFNGVSETEFAPDSSLTRAMLVTVLHRIEGTPDASGDMSFTDVQSGAYYEEAVKWAFASDIIKGTSEFEFSPDVAVTREQIAAIVLRYAAFKGEKTDVILSDLSAYTDVDKISQYAIEAVNFCRQNNIISGNEFNEFNPSSPATRAEAAAIIHRISQLYSNLK